MGSDHYHYYLIVLAGSSGSPVRVMECARWAGADDFTPREPSDFKKDFLHKKLRVTPSSFIQGNWENALIYYQHDKSRDAYKKEPPKKAADMRCVWEYAPSQSTEWKRQFPSVEMLTKHFGKPHYEIERKGLQESVRESLKQFRSSLLGSGFGLAGALMGVGALITGTVFWVIHIVKEINACPHPEYFFAVIIFLLCAWLIACSVAGSVAVGKLVVADNHRKCHEERTLFRGLSDRTTHTPHRERSIKWW